MPMIVYVTLKPCDKWHVSTSSEACIADITIWMSGNMLKFNSYG